VKRFVPKSDDAPGQDSFLDIVANLVGILIILVMVVGVRAKDAFLEAAPAAETESPQEISAREVATAEESANNVESDIRNLADKLNRHELEITYRREERNRVQLLIASAEQWIDEQRQRLDETQKASFDAQRELIATRNEFDDLQRGRDALENATAPEGVIEHLPTPMAKTVFGKELHLRLSQGRVSYVPWDEMVEALKKEAPHKVWRLKDQSQFTETLGPIAGYWMKYTLRRASYSLPTRMGVAVQQRVELDRFVLLPVAENQGETLDEAFAAGAQLQALLAAHKPAQTTITVWVYPDSYGQFRQLKKALYERGYLTASRPLPEGIPIGGSPQGTRSAAQ
jgi:hypothetical protein